MDEFLDSDDNDIMFSFDTINPLNSFLSVKNILFSQFLSNRWNKLYLIMKPYIF